jgi:hypothetical protein
MKIDAIQRERQNVVSGRTPDNFLNHFYSHFGFMDNPSLYMLNKQEADGRDTHSIVIKRDNNYDG